jgi:N-acetylmuramoyl-L-alanine amidase
MPSILIETGYLSNSKDEKYLMSKKGQTYIASAIYRAFKDYKKDYEKNTVIQTMPDKVLVPAKSELKNIVFRVQVESSIKDIRKHRKFKGYKNFFVYKQKGIFKYCIGLEKKLNRANQLKKKLRKKKFKGAFVVAFLNEKRISLKKAREMLKK